MNQAPRKISIFNNIRDNIIVSNKLFLFLAMLNKAFYIVNKIANKF